MTIPEPEVRPTRYEVSCVPFEHWDVAKNYAAEVRWDGQGWRLSVHGRDWDRFPDLDHALTVAKRVAPKLVSNGRTVSDALEWIAEREAREA